MKLLLHLVGWLLLLAVAWPLALLFLSLAPLVSRLSLQFCPARVACSAFRGLVTSLLCGARSLGYRGQPALRLDHGQRLRHLGVVHRD